MKDIVKAYLDVGITEISLSYAAHAFFCELPDEFDRVLTGLVYEAERG